MEVTKEALLNRKRQLEEQRTQVIEQGNSQLNAIGGALALIDEWLKDEESVEEGEQE